MSYGVSLSAHDVLRPSEPLRGQPEDFEIAPRRAGGHNRCARWRRVRSFLALVGCAHRTAGVASFLARFLPMSLRGLRGDFDFGWQVRMATISSVCATTS